MKSAFIAILLCSSQLLAAQNSNAVNRLSTSIISTVNKGSNPSFTTLINTETGTTLHILIQNPLRKKLHLKITHITGLVKDTTISSEKYDCRFLLANAQDGVYHITVRTGKEKFKKDIHLNTETILTRNLSIE